MTVSYPIRAAARLTGISVDTLRAWEKRYDAVVPARGPRGRQYSDRDVERLRLLRTAVDLGHSIGQAASLTNAQLKSLAWRAGEIGLNITPVQDARTPGDASKILAPVLAAVEGMNYGECNRQLGRLAAIMPARELVHRVAVPLMRLIGDRWRDGDLTVAQEHMASALLRDLLGSLLRLYVPVTAPGRILLTTPRGELHEFGILVAAMLTAAHGLAVIYLGPNLPADEIIEAVRESSPDAVVLGLSGGVSKNCLPDIRRVARTLPAHVELWLGANDRVLRQKRLAMDRIVLLGDFYALESRLLRLGGARSGESGPRICAEIS